MGVWLENPGSSPDPAAQLLAGMGVKHPEHLGPETAGRGFFIILLNTAMAPSCSLITASSFPVLHTRCSMRQDKHLSTLWVFLMGVSFGSVQSPQYNQQ